MVERCTLVISSHANDKHHYNEAKLIERENIYIYIYIKECAMEESKGCLTVSFFFSCSHDFNLLLHYSLLLL